MMMILLLLLIIIIMIIKKIKQLIMIIIITNYNRLRLPTLPCERLAFGVISRFETIQQGVPSRLSEPFWMHLYLNMVSTRAFTETFTKAVLFVTKTYFARTESMAHNKSRPYSRGLFPLMKTSLLVRPEYGYGYRYRYSYSFQGDESRAGHWDRPK